MELSTSDKRKFTIAKGLSLIFFIILSFFIMVPLIYVIEISISSDFDISRYGYSLIPKHVNFDAYKYIFQTPAPILRAYGVTIAVTVLGTLLSLTITAGAGYVMSRKDYKYSKPINFFIFFTMLFNGGLVPWYLVMTRGLHLQDTIWALIIPYACNAWFCMLMKGFMATIPFEMIEAAKVDGASEIKIFFTMILPLSKPALATIGLFFAFAFWNDWWLAMLLINNDNLVPLQYMMYRIMNNISFMLQNMSTSLNVDISKLPNESARMAMAVLVAGPMLLVFPFFQKFFVKGLTVGSVKG
jgi:putative aldouronate transport system permease protein